MPIFHFTAGKTMVKSCPLAYGLDQPKIRPMVFNNGFYDCRPRLVPITSVERLLGLKNLSKIKGRSVGGTPLPVSAICMDELPTFKLTAGADGSPAASIF